MNALMLVIFSLGILGIAMEETIKINKAATALLTGIVLWILYVSNAAFFLDGNTAFLHFLEGNPDIAELPQIKQYLEYIVHHQMIPHLGEISTTLFFVIGAMVIVEVVDMHGGFAFLTNKIQPENKRTLLYIVAFMAFFVSALLDNLATAIVMVAMLKKLIPHRVERKLYACMVIIAANAGGSWSPVGDVTTILLWSSGHITPANQVATLFLPALTCMLVCLFLVSRYLKKGDVWDRSSASFNPNDEAHPSPMNKTNKVILLIAGISSLAMVPLFNYWTGLPPYVGVLCGMVILWIYTDLFYDKSHIEAKDQYRLPTVFAKVDMATIYFFLGLLLSVAALDSAGVLKQAAVILNENIQSTVAIGFVIGALSSVLENVALVAATMGMYPLADPDATGYLADYVADGRFWTFLTYCAVTGGSILITASATGAAIMGIEKISFSYYLKHFSLIAIIGFLAGSGVYLIFNYLI